MSMISGWNGTTKGGRISPTSSIIGGKGERASSIVDNNNNNNNNNSSILPIITQQRDRFRARNAELEQELKTNWQLVNSLRKELETVKKDNVDLYEKTRYVASYNRKQPTAPSIYASSEPSESSEDRYRSAYEEGLSPFQKFKGKETERALSRMGPIERVTYSFTRIILANRLSRNLFMIYCVALHLLVMFIVVYGVGLSSVTPQPIASSSDTKIAATIDDLDQAMKNSK
jgi:homeobox protein cut-like